MPIQISITLQPLCDSLMKVGFNTIITSVSFTRIVNKVGLSSSYEQAIKEAEKPENMIASWLGTEVSADIILIALLEGMYDKTNKVVAEPFTTLLAECFILLPFQLDIKELIADLRLIGATENQIVLLTTEWTKLDNDYQRKAEYFYSLVATRGINRGGNPLHYFQLRQIFMNHYTLRENLPQFIIDNEQEDGFWEFIKKQGGYKARSFLIDDEFANFRKQAKSISGVPHQEMMKNVHVEMGQKYINDNWNKALSRLNTDAEAAVTSARTLVETVCKYILDTRNVSFDDSSDLPKLYKLTAGTLNLSPEGHTEQIFKQILSGCTSVIEGLGSLRNKHSDAHGISQRQLKPSSRHAGLAVNLSGSMCTFLLQTLENIQKNES